MINWQKMNPVVEKKYLYGLAGLMWSGVGIMLMVLAYTWLSTIDFAQEVLFVAIGIVIALAAYRFGFLHLATKNINRITKMQAQKVCVFAFQKWRSYFLIVLMIALGITLRKYSGIPKPYLAILYIGMGGALLLSSLHYHATLVSRWSNQPTTG